jgi:hypothetical protein
MRFTFVAIAVVALAGAALAAPTEIQERGVRCCLATDASGKCIRYISC